MTRRFEDAMRFVEEEHAFPARPEDVHGRRFRALLDAAGLTSAVAEVPSVVVAGSAGKASTARMIASIARASLDRAGDARPVVLGTKPPLRETLDGNRERYHVLRAGLALDPERLGASWARACWITPDAFADQVEALRPAARTAGGAPLAPYDLRYAVLARLAVTEGAALVVVEANIGLRDDVAGQWPGVRAAVLTRIGTEHASLLRAPDAFAAAHPELGGAAGPLWQKASGVPRGVPVVLGPQEEHVARLARALAVEAGALEVIDVASRTRATNARSGLAGTSFDLEQGGATVSLALGALGDYQIDNARTAVVACDVLAAEGLLPHPSHEAIREGLGRVVIPGRFELVGRAPAMLLNVTEGASKVRSLLAAVRGLGIERFVVCATVLRRVDGADAIVHALASAPETAAFVATAHGPDDLPAADLAAWARRDAADVRCEPDPVAAVALARQLATPTGTVLLVGNGLADALDP